MIFSFAHFRSVLLGETSRYALSVGVRRWPWHPKETRNG